MLHSSPTRRSSDLVVCALLSRRHGDRLPEGALCGQGGCAGATGEPRPLLAQELARLSAPGSSSVWQAITIDRKSTRLNSSHVEISYAVFCSKKKKNRLVDRLVLVPLVLANQHRQDRCRLTQLHGSSSLPCIYHDGCHLAEPHSDHLQHHLYP